MNSPRQGCGLLYSHHCGGLTKAKVKQTSLFTKEKKNGGKQREQDAWGGANEEKGWSCFPRHFYHFQYVEALSSILRSRFEPPIALVLVFGPKDPSVSGERERCFHYFFIERLHGTGVVVF